MPDYRISGEGPFTLRVLDGNGNETFSKEYSSREAAQKQQDKMVSEEPAVVGQHPSGRAILADEGADGNVNKTITESEKAAIKAEQPQMETPTEKLVRTAKVVPDDGPKTRRAKK